MWFRRCYVGEWPTSINKFLFGYSLCSPHTPLLAISQAPWAWAWSRVLVLAVPSACGTFSGHRHLPLLSFRSTVKFHVQEVFSDYTVWSGTCHLYCRSSSLFPFPSWYLSSPEELYVNVFAICLFPLEFELHKNSNFALFFSFLCFIASAHNKAWNMGSAA